MSIHDEPLPIKHVGNNGMGSDVYLVDGDLEVYGDREGNITCSAMVLDELRVRGIAWDYVLASVIWTKVCEHQRGLVGDMKFYVVELPDTHELLYGEKVGRLRDAFEDQFGRKPDAQDEAVGLEQLIWAAKLMTELGWA